ncbi:rho GTPase-activating protein 8 isoform X1 [Diorhabda carinulata]|uniref:rho GTPase-activating protein 8 isoform X1 n=2 Tax=Diorhabda carinulata TaxID=1163345 RepID=UPI0025A274AF|nr:rho GTPase-activating protein 8 isoform X1 [Diorhabda carinulata]
MDKSQHSSSKAAPVNNFGADNEEPYPSLSDYHDYEPNLEFDDSELQHSSTALAQTVEMIQAESNSMGSPISDFTDDNFEEELAEACEENLDSLMFCSTSYPEVGDNASEKFSEISKYGIVDVKGDDSDGRKIIVVYACKLPQIKEIDHVLLLSYLKYTLESYVKQDYSLIYFHYGLTSKNKPSFGWLIQAYKAFDRNYKKNLKALYLVHPTSFLKFVSQVFRPLISAKFGKKLNYIHRLKELNAFIPIEKLDIPSEVIEHDKKLGGEVPAPSIPDGPYEPVSQTQQFGVTLQYIRDQYNVIIPPVVTQCIEYLDQPDALETEGIFRRSANANKVRSLKEIANSGQNLTFDDPHDAAVLLKKFLRELKEPLLTFELYDEILQFQSWNNDERLRLVSILVMEKLPEDNYKVLKYIIRFLSRVMERSDLNKMNAQNLAVVFGPNLVWSELVSMSLAAIGPINMFTQFLLIHQNDIFMI